VRVLSRRAHETQTQTEFIRGDLLKGGGLEQAVESVSVVIPPRERPQGNRANRMTGYGRVARATLNSLQNRSICVTHGSH
jgi:hypothetical protein